MASSHNSRRNLQRTSAVLTVIAAVSAVGEIARGP